MSIFVRVELFPLGIVEEFQQAVYLKRVPTSEEHKDFQSKLGPLKEIGLDVLFQYYSEFEFKTGKLGIRDTSSQPDSAMVPSAQITLHAGLAGILPYIDQHFYHRTLSRI